MNRLTVVGLPPEHRCSPPSPAKVGSVWRCPACRTLYRAAAACDACDRYGLGPHDGVHAFGLGWRPARWWQRLARIGGAL